LPIERQLRSPPNNGRRRLHCPPHLPRADGFGAGCGSATPDHLLRRGAARPLRSRRAACVVANRLWAEGSVSAPLRQRAAQPARRGGARLRQRGRRHCAQRLRLAATSQSGTCEIGAARYITETAEPSSDYDRPRSLGGIQRTTQHMARRAQDTEVAEPHAVVRSGCEYDFAVPLPLSPAPTSPVPA
jgi:hypothetical protein